MAGPGAALSGIVAGKASYAWMTVRGGSDMTSRGALALAAAHPMVSPLASVAAMVGSLLMVPAVLWAMRLVRVGAARLG